jgi:hypothetical protein
MKKIHAILAAVTLILLAAAISACTSSSTNVSTNRSYDQDYTKSSSSRTTSDRAGREGFPEEMYVPPITLSLVAMNTGELLAGESYPIVAVVDNPENRDLRYRWSVEDGEFAKLPESLRSEVVSFESQVRSNRGANAPAAGTPTPPAEGAAAATPPAGAPAEAAAAKPAPGTEGAAPAAARPPIPQKPRGNEQPPAVETPAAEAPAEAGAVEAPAPAETPADGAETKPTNGDGTTVAWISGRYAVLAEEDQEAAPADEWPEPVEKDATADDGSATEELPPQTDEQAATEDAANEAIGIVGEVEDVAAAAESFEGFTPKSGEGRLIEVDEKIKEEEAVGKEAPTDEALFSEPPLVTFETEQPYVLWTPPGVGSYTIRCIVLDNKDNEVTPERSFPVTVTEPEPKVELVWNTTKKLHEDDYLVVELRAKNITNYYKGLFTLSFDPAILSFRSAEKGSFFPADYRASIFYAQPPMNPGKVTVAISADEVGLPKGDGVVARVIFKVKEDVQDPTTLDITQVTDAEARYILDADGTNILPAVADKPLFATDWIDPPPAPTQSRTQQQTTEDIPQTPAPPSSSAARTGGSPTTTTTQPESTYIAPSSSGFDQGGTILEAGGPSTSPTSQVDPRVQALQEEMRTLAQDQTMNAEDKQRRMAEITAEIQQIQSGSK